MYYRSLLKAKNPTIDLLENFNKQSYRNRCVIASPNGSLSLVIPVIRKSKNRFKDVKIDASQNWKKVHWKSLESAYRSSPYFEFYEDSFMKNIDGSFSIPHANPACEEIINSE